MAGANRKIYFASDLHLGAPDETTSAARERRFIRWLREIQPDAGALYILGDLFDFWHDYDTVVPKGFIRVQGMLAQLADAGTELHLFTGNHDLWMYGYFEKELGAQVHRQPIQKILYEKKFYIGHGDGLGPGDHGYKFIKSVFTNPLCRWLFKWLHPDLGVKLARYLSYKSRFADPAVKAHEEKFLGEENEWLVQFCREELKKNHYDYFIFGHRHLPLDIPLNPTSRYINTGDWLTHCTYAVYDGARVTLRHFT
ncbi:MAG: UDP-2,3-diacylglucosamine diphosphatase [Chitinophagales bacterium]|nr:UDP-2,3-diacylglucosamine diphosphatase [Chitinophagales bacterium]MDW8418547.1 UDP-2,3-diacylglucosamine diphosphatase [Chitinophagales bacterium]